MKTVLLLVVTLLSLPCFAIEDSHYEWQSITYRTYLEEIKKEAIVTVSPQHPAKGTAIANLSVKLDKHEIKIPENVIQLFQPIHPYSIRISAGEFRLDDKLNHSVTLRFNFGAYPEVHKGEILFLNNKTIIKTMNRR